MNTFKQFLTEGGIAGHMAHPFDLPQVHTGNDLIKVFQETLESLKTSPAAVKIDGINVSIKLIKNPEGDFEFALDRGSSKPADIQGVTIDNLEQRFPRGHGMIEIGSVVLSIFNRGLSVIKDELDQLGFTKDKNKLLNMEYVKGNTNVIGYKDNFLAIHGINEIVSVKSPIRGSVSRASRESKYNKKALTNLIKKINPIAQRYDFNVTGEIPASISENIDFTKELNSVFAIKFNNDHAEVKTLKNWLSIAKNPRAKMIYLKDGKRIGALSKFVYNTIHSGAALDTFIKNEKDYNDAISGAVIYHATRILGNKILSSLKSPLGEVTEQEGIVIRNPSISRHPFKITGEFIVKGMTSPFQQKTKQTQQVQQPQPAAAENEEGVGGLIGSINYANTGNNYRNNVNYVTRPPYGNPPNVGGVV